MCGIALGKESARCRGIPPIRGRTDVCARLCRVSARKICQTRVSQPQNGKLMPHALSQSHSVAKKLHIPVTSFAVPLFGGMCQLYTQTREVSMQNMWKPFCCFQPESPACLARKNFSKKCVKPIYKLLSLWYNNLVMQLLRDIPLHGVRIPLRNGDTPCPSAMIAEYYFNEV